MVKILVIEDEMEIRANLLELLSLEGYEIMGADNGVTGVIGAMEFGPDIVLCDVMMPELDGYDVLKTLRQEPKTALIPFIFLTALADKGDLRQGMELGADDYLTKPFTCSEVLSAVETRLNREALMMEKSELAQQQAIAAQQKVQAFQDARDLEKAALISDVRRRMKGTVTQLNRVHSLLQTLPANPERDQCIDMVRGVCAAELKLLARIPNFEYLLSD
ncbi:MAG: response regulator transcription factor [Phormidesmis sp.]